MMTTAATDGSDTRVARAIHRQPYMNYTKHMLLVLGGISNQDKYI